FIAAVDGHRFFFHACPPIPGMRLRTRGQCKRIGFPICGKRDELERITLIVYAKRKMHFRADKMRISLVFRAELKRKIHIIQRCCGIMLLQATGPLPRARAETAAKTQPKTGALQDWVRALEATASIPQTPERILSRVVAEIARERPDAP